MRIDSLRSAHFSEPFKLVFRHSSASRASAESIIVRARSECGAVGYGEGCPREYVTGETISSSVRFIEQHCDSLKAEVMSLDDLRHWMRLHHSEIDTNPAAFCAIELAILDLLGKIRGQSVEALLGLSQLGGSFRYSAVLGDNHPRIFGFQLGRYWNSGFRDFKVKLSGNLRRDQRKLDLIRKRDSSDIRIRLDANNLWQSADECVSFLSSLPGPLFAIEEPLAVDDLEGCRKVSEACNTLIVLDESMLGPTQLEKLGSPEPWIINVRISKMGGLLRSIMLAKLAAERGVAMIVGAHVGETSLLTRAGLTLAQTVGRGLVAMEGAYGTRLLARDLTQPSLMFGKAGELVPASVMNVAGAGLGLKVNRTGLDSKVCS